MLSIVEYNNKHKLTLHCQPFPLWYYAQNLDRVNWASAKHYLPFDFLLEHMPKKEWSTFPFKTLEEIEKVGSGKRHAVTGIFTRSEASKLALWQAVSNQNIPNEWLEPLFPSFSVEEWIDYVKWRPLTKEHFDLYMSVCGERAIFNHKMALDWIPYQPENFYCIFSHPQQTEEFILAHFEDALSVGEALFPRFEHLNQNFDYFYYFSPEHLDQHPELIKDNIFLRKDLPSWFTDKYREKICGFCFSQPSDQTLVWLRENRFKAYLGCPWVSLLRIACYSSTVRKETSYFSRHESNFIRKIKLTLAQLC